ncbi:MAG: hypothetical protein KC422_11685 [Trueperaceae bacterium]|nr:hypothetical protein [Trueperaceae bacterium]
MHLTESSPDMFYLSALIAILGAIGYQYFVKLVPVTLNPLVSIIATYLLVLALCFGFLLFIPIEGGFAKHIRQLSWIQGALALSVFLIELGFLLMYRYGWNLSTANLITGVIINLALLGLGIVLLGEKVSPLNMLGIALSIAGVTLIGYRP